MDQFDVISHIEHEHSHLTRLFADIDRAFRQVNQDGVQASEDALSTVSEDLEHAMEEMLDHFAEEEQVLFAHIEERFPEMESEIVALVQAHELICDRTRWLQQLLNADRSKLESEMAKALEIIHQLADEVAKHTEAESRVYTTALSQMSASERRELLENLQHH